MDMRNFLKFKTLSPCFKFNMYSTPQYELQALLQYFVCSNLRLTRERFVF